jgi:hypothetical protein
MRVWGSAEFEIKSASHGHVHMGLPLLIARERDQEDSAVRPGMPVPWRETSLRYSTGHKCIEIVLPVLVQVVFHSD